MGRKYHNKVSIPPIHKIMKERFSSSSPTPPPQLPPSNHLSIPPIPEEIGNDDNTLLLALLISGGIGVLVGGYIMISKWMKDRKILSNEKKRNTESEFIVLQHY